jgi:thiol:disulfide interchange protein DsbA
MPKRAIAQPTLLVAAMLLALVCSAQAHGTAAETSAPVASQNTPRGFVPQEGTDYILIDHPIKPVGEKVQVIEVFGFGCHFCADLQPDLAVWTKTLPADVKFGYLPARFGSFSDGFMRAFFTAQAMGVEEKSHGNVFKAVFDQNRVHSADDIPKLYADYGVDPKVFAARMQSVAIGAKVAAATDQAIRWNILGTPTIVVDGRYRAIESKMTGAQGLLHTVDWLVARQRLEHAKH